MTHVSSAYRLRRLLCAAVMGLPLAGTACSTDDASPATTDTTTTADAPGDDTPSLGDAAEADIGETCAVPKDAGTWCASPGDAFCTWLGSKDDATDWELTLSEGTNATCAKSVLAEAGVTNFGDAAVPAAPPLAPVLRVNATWAQVEGLCRSSWVTGCHALLLERAYCDTFNTPTSCGAQPVCRAFPGEGTPAQRVETSGTCKELWSAAACIAAADGCDDAEGVYRTTDGECWRFASQCPLPASWGAPLADSSLCPDASAIDALPVCSDTPSYDWKAQPVGSKGPWRVGYRTADITYSPEGYGGERTIKIHIWYPTSAVDGEHPLWYGLFSDPDALVDAPVANVPWAEKWPVFVHSHGHQGYAGNSAFLWSYFASHGWVVAVPDHTGNTLGENIEPRPKWMYFVRSQDLTETLNTLEAGFPGLGLDPTKLDTQHAMLGGHSYGVFTGWASLGATFATGPAFESGACNGCNPSELAVFAKGVADPRFTAGILMAGSINRDWFGATGHESVKVPVLSMSGTADIVGAAEQFDSTAGIDLTWIEIEGACHQTFGLQGCETLDEAEGKSYVATWALAFARKHVLGDATVDGLLSGAESLSAKVVVKHHD